MIAKLSFKISRTFSVADQNRFLAFSGDANPMHLDAVYARKTQAGEPVVHGIHLLLWSLEQAAIHGLPLHNLSALKVQFTKFVPLNRTITLEAGDMDRSATQLRAVANGTAMKLRLSFGRRSERCDIPDYVDVSPSGRLAADLTLAVLSGMTGCLLPPAESDAKTLFPKLSEQIGENRVLAMAQLSTLVGMVCPGLHSIFSNLDLKFSDLEQGSGRVAFECRSIDDRFGMATLCVYGAGFSGEVTAFVRQPPIGSPSIQSLTNRIAPDACNGIRALIVGGSRGLGAATAKLIAAGGGGVAITYANGDSEADAIIDDIAKSRGPGVGKSRNTR